MGFIFHLRGGNSMRKKLSQAAQERNKQLKRLRATQRRAEKAGYTFDTSPIPERATTKTLSKISGMDIWKQGYKLSASGDKEFYSPYKARQQASAKAQETLRKKRANPEYEAQYIAQRKYASSVAQFNEAKRQAIELKEKLKSDIMELSNIVAEQKKQKRKTGSNLVTREELKLAALGKQIERAQKVQAGKASAVQKAKTKYEVKRRQQKEATREREKIRNYYESDEEFDRYEEQIPTSSGETPISAYGSFTEEIEHYLDLDEYKFIDNFVYNDKGEPVAVYNSEDERFTPVFKFDEYGGYLPSDSYGNLTDSDLITDSKTGEVYGTTAELTAFDDEISRALRLGQYEESDVVVLDNHSEPIAVRVETNQGTKYIPFNPQTFSDIADSNVTDYLTALTPNMRRYLDQKIQEQKSEEGEDNFYARLKDNAPKYGYAFERVIKYGSYTELVEDFYEAAALILGGELDDSERYAMEEAVNADREYRSNAKGHIRVH
jgi:hypothetical protein